MQGKSSYGAAQCLPDGDSPKKPIQPHEGPFDLGDFPPHRPRVGAKSGDAHLGPYRFGKDAGPLAVFEKRTINGKKWPFHGQAGGQTIAKVGALAQNIDQIGKSDDFVDGDIAAAQAPASADAPVHQYRGTGEQIRFGPIDSPQKPFEVPGFVRGQVLQLSASPAQLVAEAHGPPFKLPTFFSGIWSMMNSDRAVMVRLGLTPRLTGTTDPSAT